MIASEEEARAFVAARCEPAAFRMIDAFARRLRQENERQNLISADSLDLMWSRHIADSAQLLDHAPTECSSWLDLGTGAGFPGLVIAMMRPEWPVTMIESRKLRVEWLHACLQEASLGNSRVLGVPLERAETVRASVISARAFAPLPKLIASAKRFSTSNTLWLLPKGRSAAQEAQSLPPNLRRMFHVEQSATRADSGIVIGRVREGKQR